jgi:hypothetical protein
MTDAAGGRRHHNSLAGLHPTNAHHSEVRGQSVLAEQAQVVDKRAFCLAEMSQQLVALGWSAAMNSARPASTKSALSSTIRQRTA